MRKASASVSLYVGHQYSLSLLITKPTTSVISSRERRRTQASVLYYVSSPSLCRRVLADELSFATLEVTQNATYKGRSSFSKVGVEALMSHWNLNALFIPDLLGRPNYWSPELYSSFSNGNAPDTVGKSARLIACGVLTFPLKTSLANFLDSLYTAQDSSRDLQSLFT